MHGHILYSYQEDMVTIGIMFAVMPLCVPVYEAIHDIRLIELNSYTASYALQAYICDSPLNS